VGEVDWPALLVTDLEFNRLRHNVEGKTRRLKVNWLDHATLDRLYVMIMPDGSLTIPSGPAYPDYGRFVEVTDLTRILDQAKFDSAKHNLHAQAWSGKARPVSA
jgi:hypothetical protein